MPQILTSTVAFVRTRTRTRPQWLCLGAGVAVLLLMVALGEYVTAAIGTATMVAGFLIGSRLSA